MARPAQDDDEPDPRYNSIDAFDEWFDRNVRSLQEIELAGEDFMTVVREWCVQNNHDYREDDGVYNMNIQPAGKSTPS